MKNDSPHYCTQGINELNEGLETGGDTTQKQHDDVDEITQEAHGGRGLFMRGELLEAL